MSDLETAAKTLVTMLGLPKPLISVWIHRPPIKKAKPIICLSLNPKTPRATMAQISKKIPGTIHGIEIRREKWSAPVDEQDYLTGLARLMNNAAKG